jgi:hypothetical protein
MDKKALIVQFIEKLEAERAALAEAALHTYEAATHEESEPEDQYDTRGLEASYLAGAQAKRVGELEQLILTLRFIELKHFTSTTPISASALIQVSSDDKVSWCFLLPSGGGMTVEHDGHSVQIVTPKSPLGEALVGRTEGQEVVVDIGSGLSKTSKEYEILKVV